MTASKSAGYTLTNTLLSSTDGMSLALNGVTTANLTDTGAGGNTFTVSGWAHGGTLTGTLDIVAASKAANYTLTNTLLSSTDGLSLALSGIMTANLTATGGSGHSFIVSAWTGTGSLTGSTFDRDGEQERRLHLDQHVAVVHRWHVAGLERHHRRQPDRHGQRSQLHRQRLDWHWLAHRPDVDPDGCRKWWLQPDHRQVDLRLDVVKPERDHDRQPH